MRSRFAAPGSRDTAGAVCAAARDAVGVPPLWTFQALDLVAVVRPPSGGAVLAPAPVYLFEAKLSGTANGAGDRPGPPGKLASHAIGPSGVGLVRFFGALQALLVR
jgi:hypothetical protein